MPYKVKRGVVLVQTTATETLCNIMENAVSAAGLRLFWITSGAEGAHGVTSLHYEAKALDIRNRDWRQEAEHVVLGYLAKVRDTQPRLHFLLETDHLHIEWRDR